MSESYTPPKNWVQKFINWDRSTSTLTIETMPSIQDWELAQTAIKGLDNEDLIGLVKYLVEAKSGELHFQLREKLVEIILGESEIDSNQIGFVRHKDVKGHLRSISERRRLVNQTVTAILEYYKAGGLVNYSAGIEAAAKAINRSAHLAKKIINKDVIEQIELTVALCEEEAEDHEYPDFMLDRMIQDALESVFEGLAKSKFR